VCAQEHSTHFINVKVFIEHLNFGSFANYISERHVFLPGVDFTNILHKASALTDPKSAKNTVKLSVFFVLLGSVCLKAAHKTLIKLTPGINFISIILMRFSYESELSSLSLITFGFVIFGTKILYEKRDRKMLMKYPPQLP